MCIERTLDTRFDPLGYTPIVLCVLPVECTMLFFDYFESRMPMYWLTYAPSFLFLMLRFPTAKHERYSTYIVVVAASKTTSWYEFLVDNASLKVDDPPPLCVSPSSGRFEVVSSFHVWLDHQVSIAAHRQFLQPYFYVFAESIVKATQN